MPVIPFCCCWSMRVHWLSSLCSLPAVVCAKMNALVLPLHVVRLFCRCGLRCFLCSLFFVPFPLRFSPVPWVSLCFDAFLPVSFHLVSASIALGNEVCRSCSLCRLCFALLGLKVECGMPLLSFARVPLVVLFSLIFLRACTWSSSLLAALGSGRLCQVIWPLFGWLPVTDVTVVTVVTDVHHGFSSASFTSHV